MTDDPDDDVEADDQERQKQVALNLMLDAWEEALSQGIEPEIVATVAITAAVTDMVDRHGEESMAKIMESLPARIRAGEYTLRSGNG